MHVGHIIRVVLPHAGGRPRGPGGGARDEEAGRDVAAEEELGLDDGVASCSSPQTRSSTRCWQVSP